MSHRSPPLGLAGLLSSLVLALAASGCGSATATLDPIARAADVTTRSGGSQVAMTVTVQAPGLVSPVTLRGSGHFDMSRQEGELAFDLEGQPAAARASLPGGPLHITELFKRGVLYIASPLFEGRLPGGAKWLEVNLAKVESSLGIDVQSLIGGQSDPAQFLQYLRADGGSVAAAGRERVRGVETIRYDGTIDLERAAQRLPSGDSEKFKALLAATGVSSLPVTASIDARGLLRRMTMRIPIAAAGNGGAATVDYEMFGFGASPAIAAPPAGETFDATKLSLQALPAGG